MGRAKGHTIRPVQHQTGKTFLPRDITRIALTPGMRISRNGNEYFESRANRSDRNPKRKL